jgi:ketosteroid isomerase-like protein
MSRENANAEIIRRFAEAFNARDEAGLMSAWWPDAEVQEATDVVPDPKRYRGIDEIRRYWTSYWKLWADAQVDIKEIRTLGNRVVVDFAARFAGQSGPEVSTRFACVATYAGGKAVEITLYRHLGDALEAVGLRE